jgi:uncharacterized protein (TIGR00270 family)
MAVCELCGHIGATVDAIVEGSVLNVCRNCLAYGDAVEIKKPDQRRVDKALKMHGNWKNPVKNKSMEDEIVVRDFARIVKRARMGMRMKQDDAAKAIAEKVSVLQKVETGALEPSLKLAKKLEQFFGVKLIKKQEKVSGDVVQEFSTTGSGVTIGDLIKFKKG